MIIEFYKEKEFDINDEKKLLEDLKLYNSNVDKERKLVRKTNIYKDLNDKLLILSNKEKYIKNSIDKQKIIISNLDNFLLKINSTLEDVNIYTHDYDSNKVSLYKILKRILIIYKKFMYFKYKKNYDLYSKIVENMQRLLEEKNSIKIQDDTNYFINRILSELQEKVEIDIINNRYKK